MSSAQWAPRNEEIERQSMPDELQQNGNLIWPSHALLKHQNDKEFFARVFSSQKALLVSFLMQASLQARSKSLAQNTRAFNGRHHLGIKNFDSKSLIDLVSNRERETLLLDSSAV